MVEIVFSEAVGALVRAVVLVVVLFEDQDLVGRVEQVNLSAENLIKQALAVSKLQDSDFGESCLVVTPNVIDGYPEIKSIILVNAGKSENFDFVTAEKIGGKIFQRLKKEKVSEATVLMEHSSQLVIPYVANGVVLSDFDFNKYKSEKKDNYLEKVVFAVDAQDYSTAEFKYLNAVTEGVKIARTLVSEPPNILYPDAYAQNVKEMFKKFGNEVKVDILDDKAMMKHGMHALLGVGQGSSQGSRLVTIQFNGSDDKNSKPIAFVGKGITFDTGGISLKPSRGMWDMKYDMAGSAAVVGAMYSLAERNASINAVGVVALAENAISGNAQRPSDVVTSMSGQTIEVLNTDAEGRLVLADALSYTQEFFEPECIIDLATLTGAIVVALGDQYAGLFSNNDILAENIISAGLNVNEKVWRFPLSKEYDKQIDSDIADMQNISIKSTGADSITAAQFLQRFVKDGQKWAHLDIAGVAWRKELTDVSPKGATGFGVRLLNELSAKYYESSKG